MIIPLLPSDKHCVIFTSYSDLIWRELHLIPTHVTSVQVKALTTDESICLIRGIMKKARKMEVLRPYTDSHHLGEFKSFLENGLQNLPLAVRLLAFQLIEARCARKTVLSAESPSEGLFERRPTSDRQAAGVSTFGASFISSALLCGISFECTVVSPFPCVSYISSHWYLHLAYRTAGAPTKSCEHEAQHCPCCQGTLESWSHHA